MKRGDARVLLTGATGGIGAAVARRLAADGATLLLTGRREPALAALAAELRAMGAVADGVVADLADPAGRVRLAEKAAGWHGGVNVVVHNAGTNVSGLFDTLTEADIDRVVAANITAPMQLTRLLLPGLRTQGGALLLFVGSGFGTIGYPGFAAYGASKFALRGFAEALRRELADSNVRVSLLAPRAVDTPLNDERVRALQRATGMKVDPPERIAEAVADLIRRPRPERHIGWPERLFARLNRLAPRLLDNALRKQLPAIREPLESKHDTSSSTRKTS